MKSEHCIDTISTTRPQHGFGLPPWVAALFRTLGRWTALYRQRNHLAELDDRMLRDIGLSRGDVQIEIEKPFWRP
jgi:uncharacterized protein YjiS (DUF1127 family)